MLILASVIGTGNMPRSATVARMHRGPVSVCHRTLNDSGCDSLCPRFWGNAMQIWRREHASQVKPQQAAIAHRDKLRRQDTVKHRPRVTMACPEPSRRKYFQTD